MQLSEKEIATLREEYAATPRTFAVALEERLAQNQRDPIAATLLLALAERLGVAEVAPALRRLAVDRTAPPALQVKAAYVLLAVVPTETGRLQAAFYTTRLGDFDNAAREGFLSLIDRQPIPAARATVDEGLMHVARRIRALERDGVKAAEVEALGIWGYLDSQLQRKRIELARAGHIETAVRSDGVRALIDEFLSSWADQSRRVRALQTIRRLGLRDAALAAARNRRGQFDERTVTILLDLRAQLGDLLSDEEQDKLRAIRPPG